MAHNGKTSLTEYDLSVMHEWEIEKVEKAVAKRNRRDKREEKERQIKAKKKVKDVPSGGEAFEYEAARVDVMKKHDKTLKRLAE